MKKICFIIPGFGQGGAQRQCALLLNELAKQNIYELHLIYFYEGVFWNELNKDEIHLHKGPGGSMWSIRSLIRTLFFLRSINPDLVFSWLHSCDVYTGIIKPIFFRFRWIMAERDSFYPSEFRYAIREFFSRFSDAIACNSKSGVSYWLARAPNKRISLHNNIINYFDKNNMSLNSTVAKFDFLYAGRIEEQKNILFLAEVFRVLGFRHGFKCCIVGDGSYFDQVVCISSGTSNANIFDVIPFSSKIIDFYLNSKIFVSLSSHEGTPNTVIENIWLGNIVVVSRIPEHLDILGENYPFYWTPGEDIESCVSVLCEAIAYGGGLDSIYQYARQKLEKMNSESVCDEYVSLFKQIIGE